MDKELIDEFIDYAKKVFEVTITIVKSSESYSFEKIFGHLPEETCECKLKAHKGDAKWNKNIPTY